MFWYLQKEPKIYKCLLTMIIGVRDNIFFLPGISSGAAVKNRVFFGKVMLFFQTIGELIIGSRHLQTVQTLFGFSSSKNFVAHNKIMSNCR